MIYTQYFAEAQELFGDNGAGYGYGNSFGSGYGYN